MIELEIAKSIRKFNTTKISGYPVVRHIHIGNIRLKAAVYSDIVRIQEMYEGYIHSDRWLRNIRLPSAIRPQMYVYGKYIEYGVTYVLEISRLCEHTNM